MLKLTGCAVILGASFLMGRFVYSLFQKQVSELETFQLILSDIISTFKFSPLPISELLSHYTAEEYLPYSPVFESIAMRLEDSNAAFISVWKDAFTESKGQFSLKDAQMQLILSVGEALSLDEAEKITARLALAAEKLGLLLDGAVKEKNEKGKMYQKLIPICGGFLIVLLL